jgi:signal transduction histidine kinase
MRLPDFIETNEESILAQWEAFARTIWPPGMTATPVELRDHAGLLLQSAVRDIRSVQSGPEQTAKSRGLSAAEGESELTQASTSHGAGRAISGFEISGLVAEYRALRASVLRLWRENGPEPDAHDLDDVTRFNESIDQSLTHAILRFVDYTESERAKILANEKAARKEAEQANRSKDEFLAMVSHELRTPLTPTLLITETLLERADLPSDVLEELRKVRGNIEIESHLIEDLLSFARIGRGTFQIDLCDIDVHEAVHASAEMMLNEIRLNQQHLHLDLKATRSRISGDIRRLQQVFWNLLKNASKFTPEGGNIRVGSRNEPAAIIVIVSDTGRGILPEALPHIFESFRQENQNVARRYGGLGLGLAIAKATVEAHGGTIWASSDGPGRGATFTVRLPCKPEDP